MTLNELLNRGRIDRATILGENTILMAPAPLVECVDGYKISIQASENAYCNPRVTDMDVSVYVSFELGFPSEHDDLIEDYAEESNNQTDTIFAYVPRKLVEELLAKHGGIKE